MAKTKKRKGPTKMQKGQKHTKGQKKPKQNCLGPFADSRSVPPEPKILLAKTKNTENREEIQLVFVFPASQL